MQCPGVLYRSHQPGIQRVQALADISRSALMLSWQWNPCTDYKSSKYRAQL